MSTTEALTLVFVVAAWTAVVLVGYAIALRFKPKP